VNMTTCDCLLYSEVDHEYHGDPACPHCGGSGFSPDFDDPIKAQWVRQEDPMGCWVASMAMVVGKTYAEVKAETGDTWKRGGHNWRTGQYLAQNGFAIALYFDSDQFNQNETPNEHGLHLNKRWADWPFKAFAPIHVCQVTSPVGGHLVVMLADGSVLDPAIPTRKSISDYAEVREMIGIWKVSTLSPLRLLPNEASVGYLAEVQPGDL